MTETQTGGEKPHKILTGTIEYAVTIDQDGRWQVEYNDTVQNRFAANSIMAIITLGVKENYKTYLKADPKNKALSDAINKSNRGLEWLKMNWQSLYYIIMEEEKNTESAGETTITKQDIPTEE